MQNLMFVIVLCISPSVALPTFIVVPLVEGVEGRDPKFRCSDEKRARKVRKHLICSVMYPI